MVFRLGTIFANCIITLRAPLKTESSEFRESAHLPTTQSARPHHCHAFKSREPSVRAGTTGNFEVFLHVPLAPNNLASRFLCAAYSMYYWNHLLLVSNLLPIHLDVGDLKLISVLQLSSYLIFVPFVFSISSPLMSQSQPQETPSTTCTTCRRIVYYTIVSSNANGNRGRYFAKVSKCMRNFKA